MTPATLRPCTCSLRERVPDGAFCWKCGGVIPLASQGLVDADQFRTTALAPWWNEELTADFGLDTGRLKGCVRVLVGLAVTVALWWWLR